MKLSKIQRQKLRDKYDGRCGYCGIILAETGWHADHVKPVLRELKFARGKNDVTRMVATGKVCFPGK